jgi:peptidyl-tRNA hydrolase, PTH1 family
MKLIVGLGNPGREYVRTRHNIGFMVLDALRGHMTGTNVRNRFRSQIADGFLGADKISLLAPQTYMNLSGHAVREARNWYRLDNADVLVVYDDMDLSFGILRFRSSGSAGGHNGMRSIIEQLGSDGVARLKIGIGRPRSGAVGHVLSRFSPEEESELPDLIDRSVHAVRLWIDQGIIVAMNEVNRKLDDTVPS